jgi:hypothetical protein
MFESDQELYLFLRQHHPPAKCVGWVLPPCCEHLLPSKIEKSSTRIPESPVVVAAAGVDIPLIGSLPDIVLPEEFSSDDDWSTPTTPRTPTRDGDGTPPPRAQDAVASPRAAWLQDSNVEEETCVAGVQDTTAPDTVASPRGQDAVVFLRASTDVAAAAKKRMKKIETMNSFPTSDHGSLTCQHCHETKPTSSFGVRDGGHRKQCKSCQNMVRVANKKRKLTSTKTSALFWNEKSRQQIKNLL